MPPLIEVAGKRMENPLESPVTAPLLKSSVTGLIGRISTRKVFPRRSRSKNPQDAIEYIAWVAPWPAPAVRPLSGLRKTRLNKLPLLFGEVHAIPLRGGPVTTAREFMLRGSE